MGLGLLITHIDRKPFWIGITEQLIFPVVPAKSWGRISFPPVVPAKSWSRIWFFPVVPVKSWGRISFFPVVPVKSWGRFSFFPVVQRAWGRISFDRGKDPRSVKILKLTEIDFLYLLPSGKFKIL